MRRLIKGLGLRARRRGDDEGSLLFAMLVVVVGLGLSAVMTPMLISQLTSTTNNRREVHELHAAQSGIDTAMARLRACD